MAPRRRNEVVSSIVMYAGVLPAAIYWARRENDRAPWIAAAAVCAAVVRHRTTILDAFTLKIPAVLRLLLAEEPQRSQRYMRDDDDLPDLVALNEPTQLSKKKATKQEMNHDAYIWCRHDLNVCKLSPSSESMRVWDPALGAIPLHVSRRWNRLAQQQQRISRSDTQPPPPPRERRVVFV